MTRRIRRVVMTLCVALTVVVAPISATDGATDADGGDLKSLGGSFVVFDSSVGGSPCWAPASDLTLCFRGESFTDDWEWGDHLWLSLPADWTVTGAATAGSASCDNGGSFGGFSWSAPNTNSEIDIAHGRDHDNPVDHCTAYYCIDVTTGAGSGLAHASWYWSGDGWGDAPHYPCSDDGYTPAGETTCDQSIQQRAEIPDCSAFGSLDGTIRDAFTTAPTCTTATVTIEPGGATSAADASGVYGPVFLTAGTYDVTASADGFDGGTATAVSVIAGTTTTQDFDLLRPVADASPSSIETTVAPSSSGDETLTISNLGYDPTLDWTLREMPPVKSASPLTPVSVKAGSVRIEPELQDLMRAGGDLSYLIDLRERPDLSPALAMDWHARGRFVVDALRETAERSQSRVREYLDDRRVKYQAFWIDNVIVVPSSSREVFDGLLDMAEIDVLRARRTMAVIDPSEAKPAASAGRAIEPNLSQINADQAWGLGFRGEGMVVANIDTGARHTHEVLEPHYRGRLGVGTYDHDYNWLSGDGSSATPVDGHGHGSHTMGTMVGDDGGTNQIGVAPGAKWIACEGCPGGSCPDASLLTCAQWIAAPYPVGDPTSPDPSKRPHVVNNSWGDCGTSYDDWYQASVDAWHAAGIYPVFSNGNASNCFYPEPPGCNTVGNPGRYGNVTGVGSTGQANGAYASHSNWGPTDNLDTVNPNGFPSVKPNVAAPGEDIRSSLGSSDTAYASWDGTSMSAPHVAGLIALMWQAGPCLIGDYATTEDLVQSTALAIPYASACGDEGPGNVPNMATGWGEIDAYEAVVQAAAYCNTDWLPWVSESPESGQVASGLSEDVTLTFTCPATPGDETGSLRIITNDPCAPTTDIPLTLHCEVPAVEADLAVSKTDELTTAIPGAGTGYVIIVSNAGPDAAPGATVADTMPGELIGVTWTCTPSAGATCTAAGSGDISDTVDLPAGSSVVYSVSATIDPGATGVLSNTATAATPSGVTDPVPGNNSATDTTDLYPLADLSVRVTDGVCFVLPGDSTVYTVMVDNQGASDAPAASVADTLPAGLTIDSWTCTAIGGAVCGASSGAGSLTDSPNLPVGGRVTYTVNASVSAAASGWLIYDVTASPGAGVTDPDPTNDTGRDRNALELPVFCDAFETGDTSGWDVTAP